LDANDGVVVGSVFKPWPGGVDPGKKIGRESFVLVHQGFVALVNLKGFRDSVGGLFGLLVTSKSVVERSDVSHDGSFVWFSHFDEFFGVQHLWDIKMLFGEVEC
jgi:hypothetical protein